MELKTFSQIEEEYAKELGYQNSIDFWEKMDLLWDLKNMRIHYKEVAKRYAEQAVEESANRTESIALLYGFDVKTAAVQKETILNVKMLLK